MLDPTKGYLAPDQALDFFGAMLDLLEPNSALSSPAKNDNRQRRCGIDMVFELNWLVWVRKLVEARNDHGFMKLGFIYESVYFRAPLSCILELVRYY